jgi:hypothetical protein
MTRDGGPKGRFGTCVDQSGFAAAIVTTGLIDPIVTTRFIERGSQGWENNVGGKIERYRMESNAQDCIVYRKSYGELNISTRNPIAMNTENSDSVRVHGGPVKPLLPQEWITKILRKIWSVPSVLTYIGG